MLRARFGGLVSRAGNEPRQKGEGAWFDLDMTRNRFVVRESIAIFAKLTKTVTVGPV